MVVAKLEGEFFLSISHSLTHSLAVRQWSRRVCHGLPPPKDKGGGCVGCAECGKITIIYFYFIPLEKEGPNAPKLPSLSPPPPNGLSRLELEKKQIFFPGSEGNSARSWDSAWSVLIVSTVPIVMFM